LVSIDFQEFKSLLDKNNWDRISEIFIDASRKLEKIGADSIVMCASTPHHVSDTVQKEISIPLLHIAEATANEVLRGEINKVLLLGTKFTMEQEFFKKRLLISKIETLIPDQNDREFIHQNIFAELGRGIFKPETKRKYLDIIDKSVHEGAEGVIFGCTEIPMLIKQEDCRIPTFDTTLLHVRYAVDFALA
ncbi:MAG TPA: amino acid racemase, partial [Cyclobacteriaceae bacterium]